LLANAYDLKVSFAVVGKEPAAFTTRDVLAFLKNFPDTGTSADDHP
jgi:hypothetical protein